MNKEKARIRTDRFGKGGNKFNTDRLDSDCNKHREFQSEIRPRNVRLAEHSFKDTVANLKNFKRKDVSSRNYKLKKDDVPEGTSPGKGTSSRFSKVSTHRRGHIR
jgi:hypothetical protein